MAVIALVLYLNSTVRRPKAGQPNDALATALLGGQKSVGVAFRQRKTQNCRNSLAFLEETHAELHGKTGIRP
jgi:hypothetical protein